jgi:adenosylcobinamide-GDP ribazoletransferase
MLRIMKQSDIGPFGVLAILAVLLLDVAALTACLDAGFGWQAVAIATTASRLTLPWSCRTSIRAARPDGLGSFVAATVHPLAAALTTTAVLAATLALVWLTHNAVAVLIGAATAVLLAVATSLLTSRRAVRALGGTTGDVLGATVELALPMALLALALAM